MGTPCSAPRRSPTAEAASACSASSIARPRRTSTNAPMAASCRSIRSRAALVLSTLLTGSNAAFLAESVTAGTRRPVRTRNQRVLPSAWCQRSPRALLMSQRLPCHLVTWRMLSISFGCRADSFDALAQLQQRRPRRDSPAHDVASAGLMSQQRQSGDGSSVSVVRSVRSTTQRGPVGNRRRCSWRSSGCAIIGS